MERPLQPASEPAIAYRTQFEGSSFASPETRVDAPTLAVALVIIGGYGLLTLYFKELPFWIAAPLTALWVAWYGSLQHETIHNHPTQSRRLNSLLGSLPICLWLPYRIYRASHRRHHRHGGRHLTEVTADPETFFLAPGSLAGYGWVRRWLHGVNCTLAGRLSVGPALSLLRFAADEGRMLLAGDRYRRAVWLRHSVSVALVLLWITQVCHISIWSYCMFVVYPSIALNHLRSFTEHRADENPLLRTVTVEAGPFWSLLFLNNNLHIAHHANPDIPWFALPEAWRRMRQASIDDGLVFEHGYPEVTSQYLLVPVLKPEHPGASGPGVAPP